MSFTIRPTRPEEAALLPAIERSAGEAFRVYPDLAWLADGDDLPAEHHALRIAEGLSWVAVDAADAPFGFLIAERFEGALHIEELDVRQDRQGRGVGRALLRHVIAWARAEGLHAVTLTTFRDVAWNAPFYAREGFELLEGEAIDARLQALLVAEADRGLKPEGRCAMRFGF
ncbi:MAG: GNAT family N-acetyltransferase [Proteobacteria bacterium]|nr:GNAT family N-acetyltransferase [Pseudomonadota bacterium]